jgi:hypothetical protein
VGVAATPRLARARRRFAASVFGAGAIGPAPERVRLWNPGPNPWDGGIPINLTPAAVDRVMGEFLRRGNPLSMDFQHEISLAEAQGKLAPDGTDELPMGAGYCLLERVDTPEGPAIDFLARWSDCGREAPVAGKVCCAKHQIESGQRCEFSPDWDSDPTTGEPLRVNRISLVQDGAMHGIGLLASRAERSRAMAGEMDGCRAAYAWHKAMAAAGGDDAKEHEAMMGRLKASAAALGVDLEKEPDGAAPPGPEGAPRTAAEPPPPPKEPEPPKGAVGSAALASRAAAAPPLTLDAVLQKLAERDALAELLEGNKDRIPEGHRKMLASAGLAAARTYVEGLPARPAPAGTGGDAGGAIEPGARAKRHRASLSEAERFMAGRVHEALGKSEESAAAFDKRPEVSTDAQGNAVYEFSIVKIAETKRLERTKARAA